MTLYASDPLAIVATIAAAIMLAQIVVGNSTPRWPS